MNCAVVDIIGTEDTKKRNTQDLQFLDTSTASSAQAALSSLPDLYVANLEGINSCRTKETVDPIFDNPGADVTYGDGVVPSSAGDDESKTLCTGQGRQSSNGSPPSSSQDPHNSDSQSGGSGKSKCNDGGWHPDCYGQTIPQSTAADNNVNYNDEGISISDSDTKSEGDSTYFNSGAMKPWETDFSGKNDADYEAEPEQEGHAKSSKTNQKSKKNKKKPKKNKHFYYPNFNFDFDPSLHRQIDPLSPSQTDEDPTLAPISDEFSASVPIPPLESDLVPNFVIVSDETTRFMAAVDGTATINVPVPTDTPILGADGNLLVDVPEAVEDEGTFLIPRPGDQHGEEVLVTSENGSVAVPAATAEAGAPEETSTTQNDDFIFLTSERIGPLPTTLVPVFTTAISSAPGLEEAPSQTSSEFIPQDLLEKPSSLPSNSAASILEEIPSVFVPVENVPSLLLPGFVEETSPPTTLELLEGLPPSTTLKSIYITSPPLPITPEATVPLGPNLEVAESNLAPPLLGEPVVDIFSVPPEIGEIPPLSASESRHTSTLLTIPNSPPALPSLTIPSVAAPETGVPGAESPDSSPDDADKLPDSLSSFFNALKGVPGDIFHDISNLGNGFIDRQAVAEQAPACTDVDPVTVFRRPPPSWYSSNSPPPSFSGTAGVDAPADCKDPKWNCGGCSSPDRCVKINSCTRSCTRLPYTGPFFTTHTRL